MPGPIVLHAEPRERHSETQGVPAPFPSRAQAPIRGYVADDRIVTGTGQVGPSAEIGAVARGPLAAPEVAYPHLRSAGNNCHRCRIERS